MNYNEVINQTADFVKNNLSNAEGGHDWWHAYRVWKLAKNISEGENINNLVVESSALLHDIADSKFYNGDEEIGPNKAKIFLKSLDIQEQDICHVENIIRNISFRGGKHVTPFKSLEFDIVQDADRLDALGAIGIARTFNYGGYKNRVIYDPSILPDFEMTSEEYKKSNAPTLNHFYEKLLLLKNRINTKKGKQIAEQRHEFMEQYLEQFYKEWRGNS